MRKTNPNHKNQLPIFNETTTRVPLNAELTIRHATTNLALWLKTLSHLFSKLKQDAKESSPLLYSHTGLNDSLDSTNDSPFALGIAALKIRLLRALLTLTPTQKFPHPNRIHPSIESGITYDYVPTPYLFTGILDTQDSTSLNFLKNFPQADVLTLALLPFGAALNLRGIHFRLCCTNNSFWILYQDLPQHWMESLNPKKRNRHRIISVLNDLNPILVTMLDEAGIFLYAVHELTEQASILQRISPIHRIGYALQTVMTNQMLALPFTNYIQGLINMSTRAQREVFDFPETRI